MADMTVNVQEFNVSLDKWLARTQLDADVACRGLALRMLTNIVLRTPVDTGWARMNWHPTIGEKQRPPNTGVQGPKKGLNASAAKDGPIEKLAMLGGGRAGSTWWFQNGVPYILRLENGWSQQAPAGMVRVTINEFRVALEAGQSPGQATDVHS